MALGPARLLVPARAAEPPLPSSLSSASVCSAAGGYTRGYTNLSLFFFHPPGLSSAFSISARVLEAQNNPSYRQNRHSQFHRQSGEPLPFDDLQTLYEEEKGSLSYPIRNPNGNSHPTQRRGRGGGNGGRRVWEPSNYPLWHSHGASGGEAKQRSNKPWSSQSRYESSWASQTEDDVDETYQGRLQQPMEDRRNSKPWSSETRHDSLWFSQTEDGVGESFRGGSQRTMGDLRSTKPSGDRDSSGSVWSGNAYDDGGNPPWQRQGSFFQQDAQRVRQNATLQGWEPAKCLWDSENRNGVVSTPQRQYNGDLGREQRGSQWSSSSNSSPSVHSRTTRPQFSRDLEEEAPNYRVQIGSKLHTPQGFKGSPPPDQSFYPVAPWQSNFSEQSEVEEENEDKEEKKGEYGNNKLEFEEEQDKKLDTSPITRIMERLRNVNDSVPALYARTDVGQTRGGLADSLTLPSAREYLADRSSPEPQKDESKKGELDTRFPWEIEAAETREDRTVTMARRLKPLSAAELTIPAPELRRLRILSVHLKQRVKLGKHGVTNDLVKSILLRFRTCEVVKVKCEGPPAGNMKKTLETLEQKTGGMIIWKAGSVAVIYRGKDFGQPVSEIVDDILAKKLERLMSSDGQEISSSASLKSTSIEGGFLQKDNLDKSDDLDVSLDDATSSVHPDDASKQVISRRKSKTLTSEFDSIEEYAMEMEDILEDLGPRYEEWIGPKPVPVDADLLPAIIPNYTPPYRLLPFGVRPNISNTIATHLRRLSRSLAPHFVTGRDRGLQGLAAAMVKLWEKSEIAKIGVKRGVLNTNQERLAEDLKQLTGGFFLCRDKKSMTFFRGKDFLPQAVSAALAERHAMGQNLQDEEERVRTDRSIKVQQSNGSYDGRPSWVHFMDPEEQLRLKKEAAKARRLQVVSHFERKLRMALRKKEKAGRELEKVEELIKPVGPSDDREVLTDEERFMLKKLGLKMKAFLLVGRRGVFSGVVQNMHLHWKHRELVKIIIKEKDPVQLKETATMLERESGGILISVEPTSKGYAIVVYRGKNYTRPPQLRPVNLLTKRLALKRSMEMQRRLSLSRHIQALEEEIVHLRAGLSKLASTETLDRGNFHVLNEDCADVNGSQKHNGPSENQSTHIESNTMNNSISKTHEEAIAISAEEGFSEQSLLEDDEGSGISKLSKRKLIRLCEMGPVFRAVRLTKTERHDFRNEVLGLSKAAQYLVGRSNPLSTIAKAIRLYFLDHAFIKIGIKNRPLGTSVQDIVEELEDLTGGTVYAQDEYKIILYRGWPSGENMPLEDIYDVLSPEQCDVLEEEEEEYEGDEDDKILNTGLMINNTLVEEDETGEDSDVEDKDSMVSQWDRLSDKNTEEDGEEGDLLDDESMENISDGEDIDDVRWETVSDEDEDEGDDVRWETVSDEDEDEDEDEEEGDDGQMLDDTLAKRMENISDGEDNDDVQWETVSDEDEDEEAGGDDDDDDDDSQWYTRSDGSAENDDDDDDNLEKGDDGVILDDPLLRDTENSCLEENDGGADNEVQNYTTESSVGWDSFLVGVGEEALDFDIDEDV